MTENHFCRRNCPILALRGLCVFPEQTVHFDVGREQVHQGAGSGHAGRSEPAADSPEGFAGGRPDAERTVWRRHRVAKVKQVLKTQGENLRILVTGISPGQDHRAVSAASRYLSGIVESASVEWNRRSTIRAPRAAPGGQFPVWRCIWSCASILPRAVQLRMLASEEQRLYCRLYRPEFRHRLHGQGENALAS